MPESSIQAAIESELTEVSDAGTFDDDDSSQVRAFNWLIGEDSLRLCPGDVNLLQRYTLAVLYFETAGDRWLRCSANETTPCEEERFLSGSHECLWGGIGCDSDNKVTSIHLDENNLFGYIPSELGSLLHLTELDADSNGLFGGIPTSLGGLRFLEVIDLDTNSLGGSIPEEIYDATSLRVIDLDSNALSGTISSRIGELSELYYLQLDFNSLTGSVPSEMRNLSNLQYLSLFQNQFTGSIPQELCGQGITMYANCDICEIDGCCTACLQI